MTKKLWTGTMSVELEMAIWAETEDEALKLAKRHAVDELDSLCGGFHVSVSDTVPSGDLNDAIPWGDFGGEREQTVSQLKDALGIVDPVKERLRKLSDAIKARSETCG